MLVGTCHSCSHPNENSLSKSTFVEWDEQKRQPGDQLVKAEKGKETSQKDPRFLFEWLSRKWCSSWARGHRGANIKIQCQNTSLELGMRKLRGHFQFSEGNQKSKRAVFHASCLYASIAFMHTQSTSTSLRLLSFEVCPQRYIKFENLDKLFHVKGGNGAMC